MAVAKRLAGARLDSYVQEFAEQHIIVCLETLDQLEARSVFFGTGRVVSHVSPWKL